MPHSGNSLFAWMPPGDVMKTNYSLAVWFLSPLDKLAARQCAWQAPMETKAGKKVKYQKMLPWDIVFLALLAKS